MNPNQELDLLKAVTGGALGESFSISLIVIGVFASLVGYLAWRHGRRNSSGRHMILGVALMAYPYFVRSLWGSLIIGLALSLLLFWP